MSVQCTNCKREFLTNKGFWNLTGYYGVWGSFCAKCYDKVSHNSFGEPDRPGEYLAILLKQKVPYAS